jgi:surface polysaccharide O-acyltransferase-like enzyme
MDVRSRQGWLDYLKVAAALAVVWLHLSVVPFARYGEAPSVLWWFSNLSNVMCRWAVPVFVMISGALLLGRPINALSFYKKRFSAVLWPLCFWSAFYIAIRVFVRKEPVSEIAITTLQGMPFYHLWYLFMLSGLILFAPFINLLVTEQGIRPKDYPALLSLLLLVLSAKWINEWFPLHCFSFVGLWVPFSCYFLLGYLFARLPDGALPGIKRSWLWMCIAGCISLITFANWYSFKTDFHAGVSHFWASPISPFIMLSSLCVFVLFLKEKERLRSGPVLTLLAESCLGVYLIHPFVLMLIHEVIDPMTYTSPFIMLVEYGLAVAGSFGAVFLMKRLPVLKRIV